MCVWGGGGGTLLTNWRMLLSSSFSLSHSSAWLAGDPRFDFTCFIYSIDFLMMSQISGMLPNSVILFEVCISLFPQLFR